MFKVDDTVMIEGFVDFYLGLKFLLSLRLCQRRLLNYFCCVFSVGLLTDEFVAFSESALHDKKSYFSK
jgi:hypothetical protein